VKVFEQARYEREFGPVSNEYGIGDMVLCDLSGAGVLEKGVIVDYMPDCRSYMVLLKGIENAVRVRVERLRPESQAPKQPDRDRKCPPFPIGTHVIVNDKSMYDGLCGKVQSVDYFGIHAVKLDKCSDLYIGYADMLKLDSEHHPHPPKAPEFKFKVGDRVVVRDGSHFENDLGYITETDTSGLHRVVMTDSCKVHWCYDSELVAETQTTKSYTSEPEAPPTPTDVIETTFTGMRQSKTDERYDLIPPEAIYTLAKVLGEGAIKYGDDNWKSGTPNQHIHRVIRHCNLYLMGDTSEDHMAHALTRMVMAFTLNYYLGNHDD